MFSIKLIKWGNGRDLFRLKSVSFLRCWARNSGEKSVSFNLCTIWVEYCAGFLVFCFVHSPNSFVVVFTSHNTNCNQLKVKEFFLKLMALVGQPMPLT